MNDFTRDRWGRPLITPADGGKPVAYTRVSSFGSVLENQFGLTKWKMRNVVYGALDRSDLMTLAAAARNDDRRLDDIVEQLMEAGGAARAANTGTAIHDILAQLDCGLLPLDGVPEMFRPHADAWLETVDALGFDIVSDLVEIQLVNDEFKAAGSGDNFLRRRSDGRLVAVDKKTGKQMGDRPLAYMVQLYLYATAQRYDTTSNTRSVIGDVDRDVAYIAHIPAAGGGCHFYEVDLAEAREITILASKVKTVEKQAKKVVKVSAAELHPAAGSGAGVDVVEPQVATEVPTPPAPTERLLWVKDRISTLVANYPDAAQWLARHWPENVPTFKQSTDHTNAQLDEIIAVIVVAEREHDVPFGPSDPTIKVVAEKPKATRKKKPAGPAFLHRDIDEGREMDPGDIAALKRAIDRLEPGHQALLGAIAAQASQAQKSINVSGTPTLRRFSIVRALLQLTQFEDEDIIRAIVATVLPELADTTVTLGAAIGSLTTAEAHAVHDIARAVGRDLVFAYSDDGTPQISGDVAKFLTPSPATPEQVDLVLREFVGQLEAEQRAA